MVDKSSKIMDKQIGIRSLEGPILLVRYVLLRVDSEGIPELDRPKDDSIRGIIGWTPAFLENVLCRGPGIIPDYIHLPLVYSCGLGAALSSSPTSSHSNCTAAAARRPRPATIMRATCKTGIRKDANLGMCMVWFKKTRILFWELRRAGDVLRNRRGSAIL